MDGERGKRSGLGAVIAALAIMLVGCGDPPKVEEPTTAPAADAPQVEERILDSALAGQWYTADAGALRKEIAGYLDKAVAETPGEVCALLLPHAGYRYSGQTAAHALKTITGRRFRRVVVIGPSHRVPMEGMASLPGATHYRTPLGTTPLDLEVIERLRKSSRFQSLPHVHEREHSVQIELPLLQAVLDDFAFVPIVVGRLDPASARAIADSIRPFLDPETLLVVSSDFTHHGPNYRYTPFKEDVPEQIEALDRRVFAHIEEKDLEGLDACLRETGATVCGGDAIKVLLALLPEDAGVHLLQYDTSGALTGDFTNSVSYISAAFTGAWTPAAAGSRGEDDTMLTKEDKTRLLELARGTVTYAAENGRNPSAEDLDIEITPCMRDVGAAFVTLRKEGHLRGCIGSILPSRPLHKDIIANAANAAFNDPRFNAVDASELSELHFEISVLTTPERTDSCADIEIGRHGVILSKAGRRAVFLPQVAPEQGWDRDTMLTHLAMKAGLPGDAWREGATFETFEAIVFEEESG